MNRYNKSHKYIALIILIAFIPLLYGQEKEEEKAVEETSEPQALPIIKFIPGAFQIKSGKIIKGSLLLGAFTTAIIGAFIQDKKGNDLYKKYLASLDVEEIVSLRKQTEKTFKYRNYYIAGIFGVWLLHLLDLKFFKNKKGSIKGEITQKSANIGFYYSF